jgi:hypothetical protein
MITVLSQAITVVVAKRDAVAKWVIKAIRAVAATRAAVAKWAKRVIRAAVAIKAAAVKRKKALSTSNENPSEVKGGGFAAPFYFQQTRHFTDNQIGAKNEQQ